MTLNFWYSNCRLYLASMESQIYPGVRTQSKNGVKREFWVLVRKTPRRKESHGLSFLKTQNCSQNMFLCSSQVKQIQPTSAALTPTCLPHVACPCHWTPYSWDSSQLPEYKLLDSLNKAVYCLRLQSASFSGPALPGSHCLLEWWMYHHAQVRQGWESGHGAYKAVTLPTETHFPAQINSREEEKRIFVYPAVSL